MQIYVMLSSFLLKCQINEGSTSKLSIPSCRKETCEITIARKILSHLDTPWNYANRRTTEDLQSREKVGHFQRINSLAKMDIQPFTILHDQQQDTETAKRACMIFVDSVKTYNICIETTCIPSRSKGYIMRTSKI